REPLHPRRHHRQDRPGQGHGAHRASPGREARLKKPAAKEGRPKRRRLSPAEAARIAAIFRRFETTSPDPRTELDYASPYTRLVSVVLSAQATDVSVNKATAKLYQVADTPQKMVELGEAGLTPYIAAIGLFRTKAKNVVALSRILLEQYGGEVP